MASISQLNRNTSFAQDRANGGSVLIEKVRWSIRQRLRKQMQTLSADLFEAVDDFLFSSGQQGQIGESGNYLTAMRELRTKQSEFEQSLLDQCMNTLKTSYRQGDDSLSLIATINKDSQEGSEQLEIDLALQAMHRKVTKLYTPVFRQMDSIQQSSGFTGGSSIFDGRVLLESTLQSFRQVHTQLSLPLDIRIVFLKLFEQHFLLKMEKLFLDVVSILKNLHKKEFVEKLYSSSSSFHKGDRNSFHDAPPTAFNEEESNEKGSYGKDSEIQDHENEKTVLVEMESPSLEVESMLEPESMEVSISPAGEQILDQDDLDDLAKLLGGDEVQDTPENQPELSDMLPVIDDLDDETVVYLAIDGKFEECLLHRSLSDKSSYTIRRSNGQLCLSRSRLGIALAICSGELKIDLSDYKAKSNLATVIEPSGQVRH